MWADFEKKKPFVFKEDVLDSLLCEKMREREKKGFVHIFIKFTI